MTLHNKTEGEISGQMVICPMKFIDLPRMTFWGQHYSKCQANS